VHHSYRRGVRPSVCLSVCLSVISCCPVKMMQARVTKSFLWAAKKTFCGKILCSWVMSFLSNEGVKEGYSLISPYFATIDSSSMKTVPDQQTLAADHNKHSWRAFRECQHRWVWTILNPQNGEYSEFLANFWLQRTYGWRYTKTTCVWNFWHKT